MKNLFIDTNVLLSLYTFTSDDLNQFKKLKDRIGDEITLYVPQQVKDEIKRNRENKLKEAMKGFKLDSLLYPAFSMGYKEYDSFSSEYKELDKKFKLWRKEIESDIIKETLPADKVLKELIDKATILDSSQYIDKAYSRYRIGNPPGKNNSYGDAINWECLLDCIPPKEDLYFVSNDKDYKSEFSEDLICPFLRDEWREKKQSEILFFPNLVSFLSKHIKEIQLKTEKEKQNLIDRLSTCTKEEELFGLIELLKRHMAWTEDQRERLCEIVESNPLVGRYLDSNPVYDFYCALLSNCQEENSNNSSTSKISKELKMIDDYYKNLEWEAEQREMAEAEMMDALEDYYKH